MLKQATALVPLLLWLLTLPCLADDVKPGDVLFTPYPDRSRDGLVRLEYPNERAEIALPLSYPWIVRKLEGTDVVSYYMGGVTCRLKRADLFTARQLRDQCTGILAKTYLGMNPLAAEMRAWACLQLGDYRQAEKDAAICLELWQPDDQSHTAALSIRWLSRYYLGDRQGCLKDLDRLVGLPNNSVFQANCLVDRAMVRHAFGDYEPAFADFEKAAALFASNQPATADYVYALALATCPDDCFRNGPKSLEIALAATKQLEDRHSLALRACAAAYAETGDFAQAVAYQNKAIALDVADDKAARSNSFFGNVRDPQRIQAELSAYQAGKPYRDGILAPLRSIETRPSQAVGQTAAKPRSTRTGLLRRR